MARTALRSSFARVLLLSVLPLGLEGCPRCENLEKTWIIDGDGDGYFVEDDNVYCDPPDNGEEGPLTGAADCDDADPAVSPGATDGTTGCDGADNNCDGDVDEGYGGTVYYADADGDGYGTGDGQCTPGEGLVEQGGDCDDNVDSGAEFSPSVMDIDCLDGLDHDCDGVDACALEGVVDLATVLSKGGGWQVPGTAVAVISGTGQVAIGDPTLGQVLVVNAATIEEITRLTGTVEAQFGAAVTAGDFGGDNNLDLAVGAPGVEPGEITIWLGPDYDSSWHTISGISGEYLFGFVITTVAASSGAEGICSADVDLGTGSKADDYYAYCFDIPSETDSAEDEDVEAIGGGVAVAEGWPLALSAAPNGSALVVGYSGGESPGSKVYGIPYDSDVGVDVLFSTTTTTTTTTFLGASVALTDVDGSDDLDLLVGAPGAETVYGVVDPENGYATVDPTDANLTWTDHSLTSFGAGIGLLGDLTGATDGTLAIGGATTLSFFRPSGTTFDTTAAATITGFAGPVRTILNPGDVDNDGFDDVLVCDGSNVTLLFGGPLPPPAPTE